LDIRYSSFLFLFAACDNSDLSNIEPLQHSLRQPGFDTVDEPVEASSATAGQALFDSARAKFDILIFCVFETAKHLPN
jgi:hypothetical protein